MSPERDNLPDWARTERRRDLEWIAENLHLFWPAVNTAFKEQGRGAIVVDTTSQPAEGKGNPFGYFPQAVLEEGDDQDIRRMVREYDPARELVVVLLKSDGRTSTYRVQMKPRQPGGRDM